MSVAARIAGGAAWTIALRLSVTGLGIVSTVVLARLLAPSDFGLIALATSVWATLELLTLYRFDVPLIQDPGAGRVHYDSAWSLGVLAGLALAVLLLLAAWPAARFFGEPRLVEVMAALAGCAVLDGAQNVGVVDFRKQLDFARDFAFNLVRKLVAVVVSIGVAWVLRSHHALIAGIVAASVTGLVASYAMHPYRPRWSLAAAGELFRFSKWLMLDNLLYVLRHRSSDLLIGRVAGVASVGTFSMAYELANLAQANLLAPVARAAFPGFARVAADPKVLREAFVAVVGASALVALPVAAGTAAIAPLAVPLVLGAQWSAAIEPLRILGAASVVAIVGSGPATIFLALGRPRLVVLQGAAYVVVLLISLALLLPAHGLNGAAVSFVLAAVANLPLQALAAHRVLRPVLPDWWGAIRRPLAALVPMVAVVQSIVASAGEPGSAGALAAWTLAAIAAGAAAYVATVLALWRVAGRPPGAERAVLGWLRRPGR